MADEVDITSFADKARRTAMSEPLATAANIGPALCAALGLDPARVSRLELVIKPDAMVEVTVKRWVTKAEGFAMVDEITERFELTHRSRAPDAPVSRAELVAAVEAAMRKTVAELTDAVRRAGA